MMTQPKKWYQSKTLWIAVITVGLGLLEFVQGQLEMGITLTAIGLINTALRLVTKEAIKLE